VALFDKLDGVSDDVSGFLRLMNPQVFGGNFMLAQTAYNFFRCHNFPFLFVGPAANTLHWIWRSSRIGRALCRPLAMNCESMTPKML
jgi:hypothetical protein